MKSNDTFLKVNLQKKNTVGFSLIELLVVMGVFGLLVSFFSINLIRPQTTSRLLSATDLLLSDLKSQQLKAMVGETEGQLTSGKFGINFSQDKYTLFAGNNFIQGGSSNLVVTLESNLRFSEINLPQNQIQFATVSGEVVGYEPLQNTLILKDTVTNEQKQITILKLGSFSIQ